ncbi:MAG TPA: MFS transporter [Acidimicrobiales bacterium]|nr:MFS transporter [Acidimicrobiales bacterium]
MARATTTRSPWTVLVSTSLAVFAVFLDTTILFVAFPAIRADFSDVSAASMSWVLNAYTIVFAALLIPAGRLADRVGRRRTFLTAVVLFTTASMLCGLAPTAGLLVVARILQAVGAAALVPSSLALVLQTFPRERIPVAVAIWGAIGAAAGAAGPTLGALVVENWSWRWAFFINLPVGIVSLLLGRRVLPEGRESNPGRLPDPFGVVLLAAGLALLAFGIVKTNDWGWTSTAFIGTIAASAVLIAVFVWRCNRVSNPLLDLSLFQSRSFCWANAAMLVYATGFSAMFLGNVLFLTEVWRYSILQAGLAISVGPVIVAVTAPFFGRLAGRIGQRALLVPGGLVWSSGGLLLITRATTSSDYLGQYLPAMTLTALGVSLILPQLSSAAVQGLPPDRFGSGSAVNQSVRNLGQTLGVALVVALTADLAPDNALATFHRVWWLLVGCGLVVTALSSRLPRRVVASTSTPVAAELVAA